MKLSILIPTYNQECVSLVQTLLHQLPSDCEIIVADDCSTDKHVLKENRKLSELPQVVYWESDTNLGRSRIRNRLRDISKGEYLLFIDSDMQVEREKFIERYLSCLPTKDVICGGYYTDSNLPSPLVSLRWRYEKSCEHKFTAEQRNKRPHQNIATANIMIPRNVAQSHPFDERISRYGYEDTLLGQELESAGIRIRHIDNPLVHLGLEPNEAFLHKTEEAMQTLYDIRNQIGDKSYILEIHHRLENWHIAGLIAYIFRKFKTQITRNLLSVHPSVRLFNFYKLGYLCDLYVQKNKKARISRLSLFNRY